MELKNKSSDLLKIVKNEDEKKKTISANMEIGVAQASVHPGINGT